MQNASKLPFMLPLMLDEIEDSIFVMKVDDGQFKYYYVNHAATEFSGITMDEVGRTFYEVNTLEMANYLQQKYSRVLTERQTNRYEEGFLLPSGKVSGESILNPIFDEHGNVEFVFSVTRDTSERQKYEHKLRELAYLDDLTQLYNRRYLLECVASPVSLFLIDMDFFKNINDTFGHDAGDAVLVEVAKRLIRNLGSDHILVRLGGDEFIVVSTEEGRSPAFTVDKINEAFEAPFTVKDRTMNLSVSIGVAVRSEEEAELQMLLKQADIALYRAKGDGRKRHHVYEENSKYDHVENFIHELELSHAVDRGELALHYQLIYCPISNTTVGAEALLRWNRTDHDVVPPSAFIPVAEATGLIVPIGYWVIRQASQDWHQFRNKYGSSFKVSVNISKIQLIEPDFVDRLIRILENENVTPQAMELEITESIVIHDVRDVQEKLKQLRAAGFTIALDDFGTGYSSLSMLTLLPIDKLKIDRSFIQNRNESLLSAMMLIAKALDLLVIAEGVENASQFDMLKAMNCWGLQGYYINRPIELSQLPDISYKRV
ncbi:phosphodiesterase [Cohnella endophytica]|uniref:Phosphodiesterase n=1 Tax=Cohnella endophytica TaxID=2419778 RepID=A0A494XNU3_9BACL|nr:GGDEF domain-containing phosphodiesterase [Cohnella endophytica]RKP51452.1 phosphodiesterase [Cohnella endophytica]